MPSKDTQFKKGQSGNVKGRPKGAVSKITRARTIILDMFEKYGDEFSVAMHFELKKIGIIKFYEKYVLPLEPKNINLEGSLDVSSTNTISREEVKSKLDDLKKQLSKNKKSSAKRTL